MKFFPAVLLLGPRQVGKTTLAKAYAVKNKDKCVYFDLENPADFAKLKDGYHLLQQYAAKCVILDELQRMPDLFTWLRPLIDENRKSGRFLLLGSASPHMVKGVSESLAGRVSYLELPPVTLPELSATHISRDVHWLRGGFPKILTTRQQAVAAQMMDDLITSYVEQDLSAFFGTRLSPELMRSFMRMIASGNGAIWNGADYSRSLGISVPTVNRYLQYLEEAFLITRLPAWSHSPRKRIVRSPRIYISDSGMLHRLCRIHSYYDLTGHLILGLSWEGYVIQQILKLKHSDFDASFYRTQHGAECDLVLSKSLRPVSCIEIKFSNAPKIPKGLHQCIDDLKTKNNFVITPSSDAYQLNENLLVCSLPYFLKNHLPQLSGIRP